MAQQNQPNQPQQGNKPGQPNQMPNKPGQGHNRAAADSRISPPIRNKPSATDIFNNTEGPPGEAGFLCVCIRQRLRGDLEHEESKIESCATRLT